MDLGKDTMASNTAVPYHSYNFFYDLTMINLESFMYGQPGTINFYDSEFDQPVFGFMGGKPWKV